MCDNKPEAAIRITVKVFGGLRDALPDAASSFELHAPIELRDLMVRLQRTAPALTTKLSEGLAAGYLNILINGRNVRFLQGDRTVLSDGDTVAFLPPVGGG